MENSKGGCFCHNHKFRQMLGYLCVDTCANACMCDALLRFSSRPFYSKLKSLVCETKNRIEIQIFSLHWYMQTISFICLGEDLQAYIACMFCLTLFIFSHCAK